MSTTTKIAIRRNTAVLTQSLVQMPVIGMLAESVPDGSMMFSFDPQMPANEPLVFAAEGPSTREWSQHVEHPFDLVNWCVKKVRIPDIDTGEETIGIRTTLIAGDGETLSFSSSGVARSLDLIRTLRGDGPYDPPIQVIVTPVKTRRGWQTFLLRPVFVATKKGSSK